MDLDLVLSATNPDMIQMRHDKRTRSARVTMRSTDSTTAGTITPFAKLPPREGGATTNIGMRVASSKLVVSVVQKERQL